MLFQVISVHHRDQCPAAKHSPPDLYSQTLGRMASRAWADENGVTVHSATVCAPEHTVFMSVEADEVEKLSGFLRPLKNIGTAKVTPVAPLLGP
jgi:hypothetical protein